MARGVDTQTIDMELRRCEEELQKLSGNREVRGTFQLDMAARLGARPPGSEVMHKSTIANTTMYIPTGSGTAVEKMDIPWCFKVDTGEKERVINIPAVSDAQWKSKTSERPLTQPEVDFIDGMKSFLEWKKRFNFPSTRYSLEKIIFHSLDNFGPYPPCTGFLKFDAVIKGKFVNVKTGKPMSIPGITFMRGSSVAMLVLIKDNATKKIYTILTVQPRMPVGDEEFTEIPAGMLDNSDDFVGAAAKELKEECGLTISRNQLIDLTPLSGHDLIYLSPGGCDESMKFFLYQQNMSTTEIEQMQGKLTGCLAEGEQIKLKIVQFRDIMEHCPDAKTIVAVHLYECYRQMLLNNITFTPQPILAMPTKKRPEEKKET